MISPKIIITKRCNECELLSRDYDIHEGWYDCYCGDTMIGCFCPGEDIWPGTHQNSTEYKCPHDKDV